MASGRETISAVPSTWIHGPKKASVITAERHLGVVAQVAYLRGGLPGADDRVSLVVQPTVTGDICGRPSACEVSMHRPVVVVDEVACLVEIHRTHHARARTGTGTRARRAGRGRRRDRRAAPCTAAPLMLLHDGGGVAVGQPVLVGEPVGPLFTAKESRAVVDGLEPLGECTSRYDGTLAISLFCVSGEWFNDMGTSTDKAPLLDSASRVPDGKPLHLDIDVTSLITGCPRSPESCDKGRTPPKALQRGPSARD